MGASGVYGLLIASILFGFFGTANTLIPTEESPMGEVHVNIINSFGDDLDDVSLAVFVYDEGEKQESPMVDIDDRSVRSFLIPIDVIPEEGYVPIRVVIRNDDIREVKHIWVRSG